MKLIRFTATLVWAGCCLSMLAADGPEPGRVLDEARALAQQGKYEEALQKHIWFHENTLKVPSMKGVRLSFALSYWSELGEKYPKAKEALVAIRDKGVKTISEGKGSLDLFREVQAINEELNQEPKTVELFKTLHEKRRDLASAFYELAEKSLAAQREYKLCSSYIPDPLKQFEQIRARRDQLLKLVGGDQAFRKTFAEGQFVEQSSRLITILVGAGRREDALKVREQALKVRDDPAIRDAIDKPQAGQPQSTDTNARKPDAQSVNAAEKDFRARLERNLDDHEARFGLVDCLVLQSKFSDAQELINVGVTRTNSEELIRRYARKMTSLFIAWMDAKENDPKSSLAERLSLLDGALRLDPDNSDALNRLIKLCRDKSAEAVRMRENGLRHVHGGSPSAVRLLFLYSDAREQMNREEADYYLEKSLAFSGHTLATNLARALAYAEPPDLPWALELADTALRKSPDDPRSRGTRGHILAKMGRHKEALTEFEKVIAGNPKDTEILRALSESCTKLGLTVQAEQYRKRAEELDAEKKAKPDSARP